jgi:GNAT superfamily N-acetyltransferase
MDLIIHYAKVGDVELLVNHRMLMWQDILDVRHDLAALPRTEERTRKWIKQKLVEGKLIGFIAKTQEGQIAGSGCIWLREQPPIPMISNLEVPYLMSLYTEEKFRRQGVAQLIVETAITWCKEHCYERINLDASEAGKGLYEKLGFKAGYSMRLLL